LQLAAKPYIKMSGISANVALLPNIRAHKTRFQPLEVISMAPGHHLIIDQYDIWTMFGNMVQHIMPLNLL
jgi:hypothetical protein